MGFVDQASRPLTTTTAPHHAGCKRRRTEQTTTTLALYDPSAAPQQRANDEAIAQASARALVPFLLSPEPINAVPLSAVDPSAAPQQRANDEALAQASARALVPFLLSPEPINAVPLSAVPISAVAPKKLAPYFVRAEPPWIRMWLLPYQRLRLDLPVHFIAQKVITVTDLDPRQNRLRLPSAGVLRNLRPMLSPLERKAASLLHEECPRAPKLPKIPIPGEKAKKRKGKKHGGLPVLVVEPCAGIRELQLSRWDSSAGTVIKGEGYMNFVRKCGFKVDDVVEIWAFKQTYFRLFGKDLCHDSPLYLVITKKGQMLPR